jgi:hypothetical protein
MTTTATAHATMRALLKSATTVIDLRPLPEKGAEVKDFV